MGDRKELLVFQHPTAGIQLPAGTVEDGEKPADAVIRETIEETGLSAVDVVRELLVEETVLPAYQRAVLSMTSLLKEPCSDSQQMAVIGRSGFWLDIADVIDDYRRVTHHEYQFIDGTFVPISSMIGWVHDTFLTQRIVRYHYEVRPALATQDRWSHFAEDEFCWTLYWLPISKDIDLVASNQAWLHSVINTLRQCETGYIARQASRRSRGSRSSPP